MSAPRNVSSPGARKAGLDRIVETVIYLQTESRRLARESADRLGVTPTQLNVLKLLDEIGELSMSSISTRLGAKNSTVTGIVDRMEADDLVERVRGADDRRVYKIRLSARGQKIARAVSITPWELLHDAVARLPAADKDNLLRILGKLADHISTRIEDKP
ncbi:MAG: MarR family transcriptional regulator [Deltaproteobacteria bacterium]|nr:MarR family transcriptional regulator [Deltaproteobacteria bacterium]